MLKKSYTYHTEELDSLMYSGDLPPVVLLHKPNPRHYVLLVGSTHTVEETESGSVRQYWR